jgi:hypothetical protein
MHGKSRQIVGGVVGPEVIEEEERIEVVELTGRNAPSKSHPGPLRDELRLDDILYLPDIHADVSSLLKKTLKNYSIP